MKLKNKYMSTKYEYIFLVAQHCNILSEQMLLIKTIYSQGSSDVPKHGNLVIETNFRVYAYTTSELQIALLAIFCDIEGR